MSTTAWETVLSVIIVDDKSIKPSSAQAEETKTELDHKNISKVTARSLPNENIVFPPI